MFTEGPAAILLNALLALAIFAALKRAAPKDDEILKIFLLALIARTAVSAAIHFFGIGAFFALDWLLYDKIGRDLADFWTANGPLTDLLRQRVFTYRGTAWGISYLVGIVYSIIGKNLLGAQLVIAAIGATTAPVAYLCAYEIFSNKRVAKISGYIVALMPSLVLWSSLVLKDGVIISLLIITIYSAIKIQKKASPLTIATLLLSLIGVITMRYYVFYIVAIAIAAGFIAGQKNSARSILGRSIAVILISVGLIYLGFLGNAKNDIEEITSLQRIQVSRLDLATSAASGFGEDANVSTTTGALAALPIGFLYLLLAPFPWQITSTLALTSLPEMIVWWMMVPFMVVGIGYSIRHRLRQSLSILLFALILTIGYSIMQGNVGTAYRQRAQIQVFLFIFIAVGWTIWREKREDRELLRRARVRTVNGDLRPVNPTQMLRK